MTNAQIVFNESIRLMNEGILKSTGREFTFEDENGEKHTIQEPEPIFTFMEWKKRGYSIKKGEHHRIEFETWQKGKKRIVKNKETGEEEKEGRFFLQMTYFYTFDQVTKTPPEKLKKAKKTA